MDQYKPLWEIDKSEYENNEPLASTILRLEEIKIRNKEKSEGQKESERKTMQDARILTQLLTNVNDLQSKLEQVSHTNSEIKKLHKQVEDKSNSINQQCSQLMEDKKILLEHASELKRRLGHFVDNGRLTNKLTNY
eukprot:UN32515